MVPSPDHIYTVQVDMCSSHQRKSRKQGRYQCGMSVASWRSRPARVAAVMNFYTASVPESTRGPSGHRGWAREWNAAGGLPGQFRVPGHDSQVQLSLDGLELKLYVPQLWADSGRNLLPDVSGTQSAAKEHAQQRAQEEDFHFSPFALPQLPSLSREIAVRRFPILVTY